jgi:hypothetical protein
VSVDDFFVVEDFLVAADFSGAVVVVVSVLFVHPNAMAPRMTATITRIVFIGEGLLESWSGKGSVEDSLRMMQ